jgi:hypothetical protein
MKQKILPSLAIAALLISSYSNAQKSTAFAVTAATKGNFNWNVIREIDLSTGEVVRTVYDPSVRKSINYKLASGVEKGTSSLHSATGSGVAAAAFDAAHNRLYFTGMRTNTLMYFDFNSNDLEVVVNDNPAFNTGDKGDEANIITRMAFTSDGVGYAITNDGKSLLRFTTDQKPSVANLGQLIDGKNNGPMSIHAQCSSWGGDMVGDAYGNLYLVTYRNHIYKINPKTKITDYLGQIKGLPEDFTSNGLVVNDDGEMIVSSATMSENYYKVNISTLDATAIKKKEDRVFNSSDLANSNLLYQAKEETTKFVTGEIKGNQAVSFYPNPVTNKTLTVRFEKVPAGKYNLALTDASGRNVITKALNIALPGQTEKVSLPRASAGGMYLLKLTGNHRNVFYSGKIVVQ